MATLTRTVTQGTKGDRYIGTFVSVDSAPVVPELITRFSPGTKVELRKVNADTYGVQALEGDSTRIFGEETWRLLSV